jgi:molybdopterin synthase catalytic subunit
MNSIRIQTEPFDIRAEQEALCRNNPRIGALVTFVGLMRDLNDGNGCLANDAGALSGHDGEGTRCACRRRPVNVGRWRALRLVHRVGTLEPLDPIVFVGVVSRHRGEAFRACEFLIDALKTRAPFWKKELTATGERWVEARETDAGGSAALVRPV